MHRITRLLTPQATAPRLPLALLLALAGAGTLALSARSVRTQAQAQATPAPTAQATPAPAPKTKTQPKPQAGTSTPRAETPSDASSLRRGITFEVSVMKNEPTRLDFRADHATRAEVEAALTRIEALVDTIRSQGENRPSVKARWELKPHRGSADELLSFVLERVTPAEARKLF